MKLGAGLTLGVIVALIAGGGGYWLGNKGTTLPGAGSTAVTADTLKSTGESVKKERKLLFYRNPMGLPDTSPTPKKDPMGMDYIAVFEGEDVDGNSGSDQDRYGKNSETRCA